MKTRDKKLTEWDCKCKGKYRSGWHSKKNCSEMNIMNYLYKMAWPTKKLIKGKFKTGDTVKVTNGIRKGEIGTLVRFEWVNVLGKDMWLIDYDNDASDGYEDEDNLKLI